MWTKLNSMARHQPHLPPACKRGYGKHALHPAKAFADTLQTASAKWKVGKLWARRDRFWRPALWIEPLRFGKVARVAVHNERAEVHIRSAANHEAVNLHIADCPPGHEPDGRIEPHRFGKNHARVSQAFAVLP